MVKWETAKKLIPQPILMQAQEQTNIGIIAYGSSDGAVLEALDTLRAQGIHADYLRVLGFPFNGQVSQFVASHDKVFVVEQNRDAQLRSLLILETNTDAARLIPVLHYNGMPIPSQCVVEGLCEHLQTEAVA